eukprot:scaffold135278_cov15-Prasinocladus_malaysianus.AAC.1
MVSNRQCGILLRSLQAKAVSCTPTCQLRTQAAKGAAVHTPLNTPRQALWPKPINEPSLL